MDKRIKDITGQKINRWTIIKFIETRGKSGHAFFLCKCDCGIEKIISGTNIRLGVSKSCGCYGREIHSKLLSKYDRNKKIS